MLYSTIVESAIRLLISVEVTLESSKVLMRVSSSRIYSSVDSDNIFRILFSISFSVFLSAAI